MKEFSFNSKKAFLQGLRPYHKASADFQFYDLFNFKPTKYGVVPYDKVINPFSLATFDGYGLLDEVFPFPQLFIGKKYTIVAGATRIFIVTPHDWTSLIALTTYDASDTDEEKAIEVGDKWEFADFWDTVFLTNGACTVFISGVDLITDSEVKAYVSDTTPIGCTTAHKGRVIFGGFDPTNFWSDTAETFFESWYDKHTNTGFNPYGSVEGADQIAPVWENFIWWSSIGGGDALFLFFPSSVLTSGFLPSAYNAAYPFFIDIMQRNEQGFSPLPFQDKIIALKNLGDYVIGASNKGLASIRPVIAPAPTYSIYKLETGGLASRGAIDGDDKHMVFLDNSGTLILLDNQLNITPLGYREFFYPMLGNDITISYSPMTLNNNNFGEFYICDGNETFVLNEAGLFEVGHNITSVFFSEGATIGICDELFDEDDIIGRIGLDAQTFSLPGLKTIEWVKLEMTEFSLEPTPLPTAQVSIDYQYNVVSDDTWSSTGYRNVNKEGVAYFPVAGVRFRINIKVSEYENFKYDSAEVGIKHGDKRYKRHVPIGEASTGANL